MDVSEPGIGCSYLLGFQLVFQSGYALVQSAEAIDLLLILATDLILIAAALLGP